MTRPQETQESTVTRYIGSAQKLAGLRHSGFDAGDFRFWGCVLREDAAAGEVRFVACVRVTGEAGDITGRPGTPVTTSETFNPNAGDWDAKIRAAALAADALAERAALAQGTH